MQQPGRGTQLPSIRSLHPYLPPPPPSGASRPSPPSHGSPSSSDRDARDSSIEHESVAAAAGDTPKKKRRRQALSCTECKRRKIRCDRTQPCTPCVRRGDHDKCKWHVVEPVAERYVPIADYEALRSRVGALEAFISHLPPGVLASMPPVPTTSPRQQPPAYFVASPPSPTHAYPPHAFHSPGLDVPPTPGPPTRGQHTWASHRGGTHPRGVRPPSPVPLSHTDNSPASNPNMGSGVRRCPTTYPHPRATLSRLVSAE